MTMSRWKVMAGILGVSIGGLAAIAGQCPKDTGKTRRSDDPPMTAEIPKVPSAGNKPTAAPTPAPAVEVPPPVTITVGELPALPPVPAALPPVPTAAPTKLPDVPPAKLLQVEALPDLPFPSATKPTAVKLPDMPKPAALPTTTGLTPAGSFAPDLDVKFASPTIVPTAPTVPEPTKPVGSDPLLGKSFPTPTAVQSVPPLGVAVPPTPEPIAELPAPPKMTVLTPMAVTNVLTVAPPAVVTKFRIVLRVGEGEPSFEVRHGDDLVLKVLCEKVDIKSPEKGQGLSAVTATGKVRFVGFGAEGTCDSFAFLAGTGEVAMNGNVKVQVKDKIGRVESELTTEQMKYKLDTSAMVGVLRP